MDKNSYFRVLDYGFIGLIDWMGDDKAIESAARVSYGGHKDDDDNRTPEQTRSLLRYMLRNKHTSPFEMAEVKFHISLPIFCMRQLIRHRTACLTGDNQLYLENNLVTIKDFYDDWQRTCKIYGRERIRCLNIDKQPSLTKVTDIWCNGKKIVYKITLSNGYELTLTKDHQLLTTHGWLKLQDIPIYEQCGIYIYSIFHSSVCIFPIVKIEYIGEELTYDLSVEDEAHNFICNGIVTHNSVNEISGRYSQLPEVFYSPEEWRYQSITNKQGSKGVVDNQIDELKLTRWSNNTRSTFSHEYNQMLEMGVAKELARIDMPVSIYTQIYWKIDLNNLMRFLMLRLDKHAQQEIREYAKVIAYIMKSLYPITYEAFEDYIHYSKSFSRQELNLLFYCYQNDIDIYTLSSKEIFDLHYGLSQREADELVDKLLPPTEEVIVDFPAYSYSELQSLLNKVSE